MSYHNAIDYLETKTKVLELCNEYGARVAVCPDWNGRVMTSSADGLDGDSFGMINVPGIERGDDDDSYRFLGGEDQFTLSPEGGPFSLYFAFDPEASAVRKCQVAPPIGYHEGRFDVDFAPPTPSIRMRRNLRMMNLAGARFDFDIVRTVRLTDDADFCPLYGEAVASALEQQDLSYVSYQTVNTLVNRGGTLSKNSGLVSIRLRSMFNSTPHHVIVVPFKPGSEEELGPSVCVDFFGMAPHGRLRVLDNIALLRADGRYRCQIGVSRKRSLPCIGAIDLRNGVLSLVSFEMPPDPAGYDYLSNEYCETVSHTTCDFVRTREFYFSEFLPSPREEPPTRRQSVQRRSAPRVQQRPLRSRGPSGRSVLRVQHVLTGLRAEYERVVLARAVHDAHQRGPGNVGVSLAEPVPRRLGFRLQKNAALKKRRRQETGIRIRQRGFPDPRHLVPLYRNARSL